MDIHNLDHLVFWDIDTYIFKIKMMIDYVTKNNDAQRRLN